MKQTKSTLTVLVGLFVILALGSGARATTLRAFVSSTGNDANAATNCAQSAPCRTFAGALPTVTAGGELIALDTSGYGPLTGAASTVIRSITIAAVPGATAFVVVQTNSVGIDIFGAPSDQITLRNVSFNGSGAVNTTGIAVGSGNVLIQDCTFTQLTTAGIRAFTGATFVRNSTLIGNSGRGIYASGTGKITAENIVVVNNGIAITVSGNCASTFVRVDSGTIANNTLGIEMIGGVCAPTSGSLPQNIFFRQDGGQRVNMIGNTTAVGPSPGAGMTANVGVYNSLLSTSY